jgi:hypothetical protein
LDNVKIQQNFKKEIGRQGFSEIVI